MRKVKKGLSLVLAMALAVSMPVLAAASADDMQEDDAASISRTVLTYNVETKEETERQLEFPLARTSTPDEVPEVGPSDRDESAASDSQADEHLTRIGVLDENGQINEAVLESIPFDPLDEGPSQRAVIGTDDRVRVSDPQSSPYKRIGLLLTTYPNGKTYRGSAFTMGPKVVATAAHCLYNADRGGWAADVTFIPAYENGSAPYGKFYHDALHIGGNYTSDSNDDWGMIEFTSNVGNTVGYMGMRKLSGVNTGTTATVTGYPGTVNGVSGQGVMYTSTDTVKRVANMHVYYDTDTSGGNSGGPVHDGGIAIAIHSKGSSSGNHGKGFDDWLFNFFMQYR